MNNISSIEFVQFSLLEGKQWEEYGVCEVSKPNTHGIGDLTNTVYDERMGVLEVNKECYTCGFDSSVCPGHLGYIKLATPIFNNKLVPVIQNILKCVCIECGTLRIPLDFAELKGLTNLNMIHRLKSLIKLCMKIKTCSKCKNILPTGIDKEGVKCIYKTASGIQIVSKTPSEVLTLFGKITPETLKILGFNHKLAPNSAFQTKIALTDNKTYVEHRHYNSLDAFIFTVLPVIPPFARTWVIRNGVKSDDDLTEKYNAIVKINQKFADKNITEFARGEAIRKLEEHITTLIDNHNETSAGMNRTHRGLADRIQGKGNRMQENVMAKRSDFSARTVLASGGPEIRFGEIGVPREMTKILTVKLRVTYRNYDTVCKMMDQGKINSLWRWNPIQNKMSYKGLATDSIKQKVGVRVNDTVERSLANGDWVLLNRQPTLRRESMVGCKVVIIEDSVFRIPLAITAPLGADFDGDEANIHVPQNIPATAECMTVMSAPEHIVTCQRNAPICGIVQDGLVTAFLLTRQHSKIPIEQFFDVLVHASVEIDTNEFYARAYRFFPADIVFDDSTKIHSPKGGTISGKLLFSALLPPSFFYKKKNPEVVVENGIILPESAPLCKKSIGAKENSMVHLLWLEYGPKMAQDFISHVQIVTDIISPSLGFSMGIEDCYITAPHKIRKLLTEMDAQYQILLDRPRADGRLEQKLNAELNSTMSLAPAIVNESLVGNSNNAATVMKMCGGKGQDVNATQIAAFVGQQNVGGKRADLTLTSQTRSLPVFVPGDSSPAARGFIYGNYLTGQQPHEAFFAAMSGRSGIIDTACKTSETGYIQKRIVQKVCDLQVCSDGTVRDARKRIIQMVYGGDGMDPRYLATPMSDPSVGFPFFIDPVYTADRVSFHLYPPPTRYSLTPPMIEAMVSSFVIGLPKFQTNAHRQACANIVSVLTKLLKNVTLPLESIPSFCQIISDRFQRARSPEGDMVGQHLASSMGEITTQLVLSFFHFAGMSLKDASLGVPRFVELLNLTKKPTTASCTIFTIKPGKGEAQKIARSIQEFVLQDILEIPPQLYYAGGGPLPDEMKSPVDFSEYPSYVLPWWGDLSIRLGIFKAKFNKWVYKLKFDRKKLIMYELSLSKIINKIEIEGSGRFICLESPFSVGEIHILPNISDPVVQKLSRNIIQGECVNEMNYEFFIVRDVVSHFLKTIKIQGIPGIVHAAATQHTGLGESTLIWGVETLGSNLLGLLGSSLVDSTRTISNNVREIWEILGVEAARKFLVEEITRVLSFDGSYINARHVPLLADTMCHRGNLTAVRRDGIAREEVGPIAKAAFETTIDNLFTSAIFSEQDDMEGFSARIMFGQTTKCGTGAIVVN